MAFLLFRICWNCGPSRTIRPQVSNGVIVFFQGAWKATWQAFVAKVRAISGVTQVDVAGSPGRFTLAVQMDGGAAATEASP